jgi:hypothetical protein
MALSHVGRRNNRAARISFKRSGAIVQQPAIGVWIILAHASRCPTKKTAGTALRQDSVEIAGFASQNRLDLADIDFGLNTRGTFTEAPSSTSGSLVVTDGIRTTKLLFLGQYTAESFAFAGDGHGGVLITV